MAEREYSILRTLHIKSSFVATENTSIFDKINT